MFAICGAHSEALYPVIIGLAFFSPLERFVSSLLA